MFGRRRQAAPAPDSDGFYSPQTPAGVGIPSWAPPAFGQAGWAPIPVPAAHQQIGRYAGTVLNQFPAMVPAVQRFNGVSALCSHYYYPTRSYVPLGSIQQTSRPGQNPGVQRNGQRQSGVLGPLSVRRMRARVAAASVAQTSLMAQPWAGIIQPTD